MKKLSLILLLLLFFSSLNAQNPEQKAKELFEQGKNFIAQNKFDDAINSFKQSYELYESIGQTQNSVVVQTTELELLINLGRTNDAKSIADKILPEAIKSFGEKTKIVGHIYTLEGRLAFMTSDYDKSKKMFLKSLQIRQITDGKESSAVGLIMSDLALTYASQGNLDSAIYYNLQSIRLISKNEGNNSPNLVYPLINLSNIYISQGNLDQAIDLKKKIIDIVSKTKGTVSEEVGEAYSGIGNAYMAKGEYKIAEEYLLKAEDIFKKIYGENAFKLASVYINLGNLYNDMGNYDYALLYYFNATKILEKTSSNNSYLSTLYNNIGLVCKNQKNYQNAELYFDKAYKMLKNSGNSYSPEAAVILTNIGSIYHLNKELNKAVVYFNKAIRIYQKIYGEHNPKIIKPYLNLANLYYEENKLDSSKIFLIKSINSNYSNKSYSSLNQEISLSGYYDGLLLLESIKSLIAININNYTNDKNIKELKRGAKLIDKADELISELRKSYFTKEDKIRLNAEISDIFENAVEITYWQYKEKNMPEKKAFNRIFYFMERNKTSTLLQSINSSKVQKVSNVPDSLIFIENSIVQRINIYNQKLAEAVTANEENYYREQLLTEQDNYKNLINYYKANYPNYYNAKFNVHIATIQEIQNFIQDSTEVINYFLSDTSLFIMSISKDSVHLSTKGFHEIDAENINKMNKSILSYQPDAIRAYLHLAVLNSEELMSFGLERKTKRIIIIPDGIISTVPFEALLNEEIKYNGGKIDFKALPYLIKDLSISYAYSATLLYETENQDYSQIERKDLLAVAPVFTGANRQTFNESNVVAIPGTEKEVTQIKNMFDNNGLSSDILLNEDANEYKLKNILHTNNYKIIHIATHGFVNYLQPELSALIFSRDKLGIEDGILYSGEIYNLKLHSELVNLSACETARGKISKGEGVIGLSRAFIYAGAKNLIISLWKVSDVSTTAEMTYFYKHLLDEYPTLTGNIKFSDALRKAKLDMINSKYAHPYFWSPFILIGR